MQKKTELSPIAAAILAEISGHIKPAETPKPEIDIKQIEKIIEESITRNRPKLGIEITNQSKTVKLDRQHYRFEALLKICSIKNNGKRKNIFLVGPAGSGKTTAVENVAKALNLPYYAISVCNETSKSDLMGFISGANGVYQETGLYKAYTQGGIYLIDESDAGNANVLAVINSLLANSYCNFPNGMQKRHEDFICICAGNTYGDGKKGMYVGRNQLDAATRNRFVYFNFPYDENLERDMTDNNDWCDRVQKYRHNAEKLGLPVCISPRQTIDGADLLAAGFAMREVEEMTVFAGLNPQTIKKIKGE